MEQKDVYYNKAEYIETVSATDHSHDDKVNVYFKDQSGGTQYILESPIDETCLFIAQASGNKVSRQSVLCGSQNIVLNGKVSLIKPYNCSTSHVSLL